MEKKANRELSQFLGAAALGYLDLAFARTFEKPPEDHGQKQALIGCFAAGIDLALKSFLARMNPILIFRNLPREVEAYLAASDEVPESFQSNAMRLDLRDFVFEMLPLKKILPAFCVFFPKERQRLRPYFRLLLELHPQVLGGSLGEIRPLELERVVYLACRLAGMIAQDGRAQFSFLPSPKHVQFVREYDAVREKSVRARIVAAKEKARSLKVDIAYNDPGVVDGWETFEARCPICKNWGFLSGVTEIRCDVSGEKESLEFLSDSFDCDACGLKLDDLEELILADIPATHDRSADLARWHQENRAKTDES